MNKSLLLAACMTVAVSAQAGNWFSSNAKPNTVSSKLAGAKETVGNFFSGVLKSTKGGVSAVGASLTEANSNVDSAITSKIGWFKTHNNTLQASKVVVATAVAAGVCYMLKKAYDKAQAFRASRA